jgi:hypothetical protein
MLPLMMWSTLLQLFPCCPLQVCGHIVVLIQCNTVQCSGICILPMM